MGNSDGVVLAPTAIPIQLGGLSGRHDDCGGGCGAGSREARRQAQLVVHVQSLGGRLTFEPRQSSLAHIVQLLPGVIDVEYLRCVVGVDLRHRSAPLSLLDAIGRCAELRTLDLRGCEVTDEGVAKLRRLHRLESLDLSLNRISDLSAPILGAFFSLHHLELSENDLHDAGIEFLQELPGLFSLCLDATPIGDQAMVWIGRLTTLRNLELAGTQVTDAGLGQLRRLDQLTRLRIGKTGRITDRGLSVLLDLKKLSHLSLIQQNLTDRSFDLLAQMPHLKYLNFEDPTGDASPRAVDEFRQRRPDITIQGPVR